MLTYSGYRLFQRLWEMSLWPGFVLPGLGPSWKDGSDLVIKWSMVGGVCDGFPCGPCPPVASGSSWLYREFRSTSVSCVRWRTQFWIQRHSGHHTTGELGPASCSPLGFSSFVIAGPCDFPSQELSCAGKKVCYDLSNIWSRRVFRLSVILLEPKTPSTGTVSGLGKHQGN